MVTNAADKMIKRIKLIFSKKDNLGDNHRSNHKTWIVIPCLENKVLSLLHFYVSSFELYAKFSRCCARQNNSALCKLLLRTLLPLSSIYGTRWKMHNYRVQH
jgi:hypothetical protein